MVSQKEGRRRSACAENGDQPIECGEVGELTELSFHDAKHRAETARSLAKWLVVILGGSVALHYLLTTILRGERFSDGEIAGAYERGALFAIAQRAQVLLGRDTG